MFRYGTSPKVKHEVFRHSESAILSDELDDNSPKIDVFAPVTPKTTKPTSHTVSEPKHKYAGKHRGVLSDTAASVSDYLKVKVEMDREHLEMVKTERCERQEQKASLKQLNLVMSVILMEGASAELKAAANAAILKALLG